jgi:hypothetical protein
MGQPFPREHVSYVSTQVRGHIWTPAVGKVDELHNLDMSTRAGAEASDTLKYFSERLPATFVFSELANGCADLPESDIS